MKKFRDLFRRWRKGEEIEVEVELDIRHVLLILAIVILAIVTLVKLGHAMLR
jgi:hypothetical protein